MYGLDDFDALWDDAGPLDPSLWDSPMDDGRHDSGELDKDMMEDCLMPHTGVRPAVPETPEPKASIQYSNQPSECPPENPVIPPQHSRNGPSTPPKNKKAPQNGDGLFAPIEEMTPVQSKSKPTFNSPYHTTSSPTTSRPNTFDPYDTTNSPKASRPNFFNPSKGPVLPALKSSFSLPVAQLNRAAGIDDEIEHEEFELQSPSNSPSKSTSPYREPIQSQATDSQPILQSLRSPSTSTDSVNGNARPSPAVQLSTQQASMNIVDDSDDDLEIIAACDASAAAQQKWTEERPSTGLGKDTQNCTKTEPNNNVDDIFFPKQPQSLPNRHPQPTASAQPKTPDMAAVIARQRAMLNRTKAAAKDSLNGHRNLAVGHEHMANSKKRGFEGQVVPEDPEQVEAAMRAGSHEDDSWMHEVPEDDNAAEIEILKDKLEELSRREANGKINESETLELLRLRKYLRLQEKLMKAAKGDPAREQQEESLFVPSDRDEMLTRKRRETKQLQKRGVIPDMDDFEEDGEGEETGERGSSQVSEEILNHMLEQELGGEGLDGVPVEAELNKTKKTRKPRKKAAKDAREFVARQEEERREKERNKAQKQKARGGRRGGRKPARRGKAAAGKRGKGAAKGAKAAGGHDDSFGGMSQSQAFQLNKSDGIDVIGQMMIEELMNNDPIQERLQNPIFDRGPEPEMHGEHRKATQLQRLISNIPEGTSKKEARSDKARLLQASRSFGYAKVKAKDGKWLIKGMKSTLYHHQLLGAQWMIQRELSDEPPYGGLLADGMGLGKTVQTLACMVGNPPAPEDRVRGVKATLIVVPSAVIDQWLDEIRNHAEVATFPKVMRYKSSSKIPIEVLRDLDIVVTSYQEVMRQFPFPDQKDREKIAKIGYKKWWKKASESMGDLFTIYWYRVVLDEAHAIKNNSARTSLACQNLRSIFRWCLTGTPLLNRLEELFPYLRFLKANYSMDWKTFQRYFCDPHANDSHTRIATLLSYTMMRRTMKTTILNRAIITLPEPHPSIRFVQFSEEERIIYRITENRFRASLNVYLANGTATRNYTVFLVQLLRLRQCTSHPFMLERTIRESWTSSDLDELKARLKSVGKMNVPFYEQCEVWVKQTEEERQAARERGEDPDQQGVEQGEAMRFGAGDYGHSFEMGKAIKTLSEKEMYARVTCSLCSDLPRTAVATDCNHIFCKDCLTSYMHTQTALRDDDDYMTCPFCDKIFSSWKEYKDIPDANDEDNMEGTPSSSSQGSKSKKRKDHHDSGSGKGVDALGYEPKVADYTWVDKTDDDNFPLVPSAKTAALKAILLKGFEDAPTDKVVIYLQFRLLAKIVGRICTSEGWGFLYLTGDCSLEHRSKVIKKFREDDDVKILISGLKCGGLGLNFPWANRCISLDLWWNHAVEQQAFGRIFRIGQKKETYMTRIIVKNTVDLRLLTMQLHKLKACDGAVDSGEEKNKPSLSLRELARLFGFLRTDDDGKILSIEPDYQDDD